MLQVFSCIALKKYLNLVHATKEDASFSSSLLWLAPHAVLSLFQEWCVELCFSSLGWCQALSENLAYSVLRLHEPRDYNSDNIKHGVCRLYGAYVGGAEVMGISS